MTETSSSAIPTTLRLITVVEEIARAGVPVTPTAVNETLQLPKPTIHRLFATLEDEGFLQRDLGGRGYWPGPRLRRLAAGVLSSAGLRVARQAILRRLSREIGETCNIALPGSDAMLYLERVETEWPLRIQLTTGTKVPLYCTASGKMYLSTLPANQLSHYLSAVELKARTKNTICDPARLAQELETIRHQGYALDREEFMDDMIALAVPILDGNRRLMGTLSFHGPTQRLSIDKARTYSDRLHAASTDLSALIDADSM